MHQFLKFFDTATWTMLKRAFLRSVFMVILLALAGGILQALVELARFGGSDLPGQFPELLIIFRAVAILAWFEMSVFWLRLATQPKVDLQYVAHKADGAPLGAALVYWANVFAWAFRVVILMQLCDFLK
jgi:hypothetical protein